MTQITVDLVNRQAKQEGQPDGMIFCDIDGVTTFDDLEAAPDGDDSEFDDDDADDRSDLTSDDQKSMDGDNELGNGFEPIEEQHELEAAQGNPGVYIEEEEDGDVLLEDLPDLDPPSEGE